MSNAAAGPFRALARRAAHLSVPLAAALLCLVPASAGAAQGEDRPRQVVIAVFTDSVETNLIPADSGREPADGLLREFASLDMAAGLMSTAQGEYVRDQSILDLSQGSRLPRAVYPDDLEPLVVHQVEGRWRVAGWPAVVERARSASTTLRPGLLTSSVDGRALYVSPNGRASSVAAIAADSDGDIDDVSLGEPDSFLPRVATALADRRAALVVAEMPSGSDGTDALAHIVASSGPSDLVVALHLPPTPPEVSVAPVPADRFFSQSAFALRSDAAPAPSVGSATTRRPGLVASVDVAPTVLGHLGEPAPRSMRGHVITGDSIDPLEMEQLRRRWSDVRGGRQSSSVQNVILLGIALWAGIGIAAGVRRALPPSLRAVGLAFMWLPAVALAVAPLRVQGASLEALLIGGSAVALGLLTDRVIRWPHASLLSAGASLLVIAVDLARGGAMLTASVLGPSVASGNRFYGVSNELEPLLPALALFALAGLAPYLTRKVHVAGAFAVLGVVTAGVVGAGRLGADVGGVVTVAGAFTVGTFVALGAKPSWKLAAAVGGMGVLAIGSLIALDLLLGSRSHLANNLTRLSSGGEFAELILRRYQLAAHVALQPANLLAVAIALAAVSLVLRNRDVLLPDVPSRLWLAALVGTLAGGLAGALSNDSGPVLFVNGVIAAGAGVLYLAGTPRSGLAPAGAQPTDE